MSYVRRTLGSKERILILTGYHWVYWVGASLVVAPFAAVLIGGLPSYSGLEIFLLIVTAFPLFYGVYLIVYGLALEVAVTTDRFVKKTGLVSINTEEVSLDKIEEVNIETTILGRIFGYGTINVHGTGAGDIRAKMLNNPIGLRRVIQTAREEVRGKGE
jgi:uncharacterized membrane protein YdbT with pleckstrin-like domain